MIGVPKRVVDKKLIQRMRKDHCEYCGAWKRPCHGIQVHHFYYTVGASGPDIQENLISLCVQCHTMAHQGKIEKDKLLKIVAKRERKSTDEIIDIINKVRYGKEN